MPVSTKTGRASLTILIVFAVFAAVFLLTLFTPMVADDFNYAFSWATDERVRNIRDVLSSIACHRIYTNGRVFSHGFVQLFSFLPHWLFALCNALVAAGQAFFLHRFLLRSSQPRLLLLYTLFLIWICMPVFGQVFLWADGACNYSWGLLLALAALYPFYLSYIDGSLGWPLVGRLLYLPLAFLAGAWSEHISFSLLAACFFVLLLIWIRSRRFPAYLFILLLCGGLGYLYLMLAPSMLGGGESTRGHLTLGALVELFHRLSGLISHLPGGLAAGLGALILVLAGLILCRIRLGRQKTLRLIFAAASLICILAIGFLGLRILAEGEGVYGMVSSTPLSLLLAYGCFLIPFTLALFQGMEAEKLLFPGALFLGGLCSLPLFVFASYFPARGCAVSVLFSVLSGMLVIGERKEGRFMKLPAAAVAVVFALCFTLGTADILEVHHSEVKRQQLIREALQGDGIVTAQTHPVRSKYSAQYGLVDLNAEGDWPNDIIAKYYGLRQIRLP